MVSFIILVSGCTSPYIKEAKFQKDFIDYDIKHLTWLQKKSRTILNFPEAWQYIIDMRSFNDKEIKPVLPTATVRDTGLAVWWWKIVQGLLKGTGFRANLTPNIY